MAKRRRRSKLIFEGPRDTPAIANPSRPNFHIKVRLRPLADYMRSGQLTLIEDRRQFHPGGSLHKRPRTPRRVAQIISVTANRSGPKKRGPDLLAFKVPRSVALCARRSIRKSVIHAKGIAGSSVRKGKRTAYSSISCRRK